MEFISEYVKADHRVVVYKQCGAYSARCVYFVEYFVGNKLISRTQHIDVETSTQVAELHISNIVGGVCVDKQLLTE